MNVCVYEYFVVNGSFYFSFSPHFRLCILALKYNAQGLTSPVTQRADDLLKTGNCEEKSLFVACFLIQVTEFVG